MKSTKSSWLKKTMDSAGFNAKFHKLYEDKINSSLEYIMNPAESTLACHGIIGDEEYIISKNKKVVALDNVIGKYAHKFRNGMYLNMYLSPKCKHYFRLPYNGTVEYIQKNNGKGLPVMIGLDNIFGNMKWFGKAIEKNATIGVVVNSGKFYYALIAVGSLNVNHITMKCAEGKKYRKGDYAGHFSVGSTIVLCFDESFKKNSKLLIKDGDKKDIGENILKINGLYER
jgi:phosphatidylserine decarboxylase